MKKKFLSVVIPVFNEQETILKILKKINLVEIQKEVIIINDGSVDKTDTIIKQHTDLYDHYISYSQNKGKGFACRLGISKASGEVIIIQDADLEYNPKNYHTLVNKYLNNKNIKAVYGSRVAKGGRNIKPTGIRPYLSKFANYFLTKFSNILNQQNLSDAHTCYKMVERGLMQDLRLEQNGFAVCPEITAKLSKKGIEIHEVPIDYFGRSYSEGKKIRSIHVLEAIYVLLKYNFPYRGYKSWLRG